MVHLRTENERLAAKERDEFVKILQQAQSEAAVAFRNDGVYLEKYIQNTRHIEFQINKEIFFPLESVTAIFRRNQKLLEEAPPPAFTPELMKAMGDAAATSIGYIGHAIKVGTPEENVNLFFEVAKGLSY
uniref:Carbamoyl phosphate synthase ATP-binding domain-containing protein n=1 Tax=Lactuca sativa TaxID=4236 RepID=A0A9R1XUW1_LACSA|nr:hypothetical protein LSAT_V11C100017400 [Lactuca sativa]